ncbi:probable 28S ribosomal protein S23, mitochondrial [Bombus affinis]|uniref:probable 28S ribosomal protein S23, mitochondrial n=1 Tax=Bombus affinis TaxID=309941 RepID=UPI0021B839D1|nr:probable 28S ribosomal protein S23, mitochondrial [Bombus affinis]
MAQSRTERIGTIFTRVTSLLRADVLHPDNLPIWYEIYKAYPPKYEPTFSRKPSTVNIQKIFYEEDLIRAKFHKDVSLSIIDMKNDNITQNQIFFTLYECLIQKGAKKEEAYNDALKYYYTIYKIKKSSNITASSNIPPHKNIKHNEEQQT